MLKSWLFIQTWCLLDSAFYNELHRWADGQDRENNAQGLMFNCCPLSQTGSPFFLRRRRKAKYKFVFIRKYTLGKKFLKITMYQWKRAAQAVKEQPSSPRTLWLCIDQLQVDVLAQQGAGGAGQAWGWPCCHMQSLPTEAQQVCLVYQLCNTKWHQSGHPRSWQGGSHSWPHCSSVSSLTIQPNPVNYAIKTVS